MKREDLLKIEKDKKYVLDNTKPIRLAGIARNLEIALSNISDILSHTKKILSRMPKGSLRYVERGNCIQFFRRGLQKDKNGTYIPSNDFKMPQLLAQKKYMQTVQKSAEHDICAINKAIVALNSLQLEKIIQGSELSNVMGQLVTPVIMSDREYAKKWMAEKSPVFNAYGEPDVPTRLGFKVKSKSESMIVDLAFYYKIPLKYEPKVELADGTCFRPDFVILDLRDRSEIYIEHFGLTDDSGYRDKMCEKLNKYAQNGIILGKNLLITFETGNVKFDIETLRSMLESRLDWAMYEELNIYEDIEKEAAGVEACCA